MPKVRYQDFSGGMQNATSRFLQRDNELTLALNVHGDKIGAIKKRLGFKRSGGEVTTDKSPSVVYDGGTYNYTHLDIAIKHNDAGTWTPTTGGTAPTASMLVSMQRFPEIGKLYIGGATKAPTSAAHFLVTQVVADEAGTPETKINAGGTDGQTSDDGSFPRAKFITRWRDRLYFGYCYGAFYDATEIKSNRVVYSHTPTGGLLTSQQVSDVRILLNDADFNNFFDTDDPITGMVGTADALVVWTANSMWKWTSTSWKNRYSIGCMSHRSIQQVDVYTLWLSREGIYVESGNKPELISNKIQPIIDAIPDMTETFSWKDESHYYLWVGTLTLDGVSYTNCVIQYSVKSNSFYLYSYTLPTGKVITAGGVFESAGVTRPYIGTSTGEIFQISHPGDATPVYTDGDQTSETYPIEMKVQTKRYDMGVPEENKTITKMTVISEYAAGTTVRTSTEKGDWYTAGDIQKPIDLITINPPKGKDLKIEFSQTGTTEGPEIESIIMDVNQTSKEHDA